MLNGEHNSAAEKRAPLEVLMFSGYRTSLQRASLGPAAQAWLAEAGISGDSLPQDTGTWAKVQVHRLGLKNRRRHVDPKLGQQALRPCLVSDVWATLRLS